MQILKKLLPLIILTFLCINNAQAFSFEKYMQAGKDADRIIKSAEKLIAFKKYDLAESLLLTGIASAEKVVGKNINVTRGLFDRLANVYQYQKKYDESKVILLYILEQDESLLYECLSRSPSEENIKHCHSVIAVDYYSLGWSQNLQHDLQSAEKSFLSALIIYRNTPLKNDDILILTLETLAILYLNQKKYDDAKILYLQCLKVAEKLYGKENSETKSIKEFLYETIPTAQAQEKEWKELNQ